MIFKENGLLDPFNPNIFFGQQAHITGVAHRFSTHGNPMEPTALMKWANTFQQD